MGVRAPAHHVLIVGGDRANILVVNNASCDSRVVIPADEVVREAVARVERNIAEGRLEVLGEASGLSVELSDHDPSWRWQFQELRGALAATLGNVAVRIDHVGSTSVPGLVAKPIIDVQISVRDVNDEAAYRGAIESLGFPLRARESGHRYFRRPKGALQIANIHVTELGSESEHEHLLFRDYLRTHPRRAAAYAELKRALQARYAADRISYGEAKGPFVRETLELAQNPRRPGPSRAP